MYTKGRIGETEQETQAICDRLNELEQFLTDAMAYMRYCAEKNEPANGQLLTLAHDLGGLQRRERCFRPRVSGYDAREFRNPQTH